MYDDIRKQGARAAREGLTLWDCPYFRADAMPGHPGESPEKWRAKVEAWEAGWRAEVGIRRPPPARSRPARRRGV